MTTIYKVNKTYVGTKFVFEHFASTGATSTVENCLQKFLAEQLPDKVDGGITTKYYNDFRGCTFYIEDSGEDIIKVIGSSIYLPAAADLIFADQKANISKTVVMFNTSQLSTMNIKKIYKVDDVWTIQSSSGITKTVAEYMEFINTKLKAITATGGEHIEVLRETAIENISWTLQDNFVCDPNFGDSTNGYKYTVVADTSVIDYMPVDASHLSTCDHYNLANLTKGTTATIVYAADGTMYNKTLGTAGTEAVPCVRLVNISKSSDFGSQNNIILNSIKTVAGEQNIHIWDQNSVIYTDTTLNSYEGFEISEFDTTGDDTVEYKLNIIGSSCQITGGDTTYYQNLCIAYIEHLTKTLTSKWEIKADYFWIKSLTVEYMTFMQNEGYSTTAARIVKIGTITSRTATPTNPAKLTFEAIADLAVATNVNFLNIYSGDNEFVQSWDETSYQKCYGVTANNYIGCWAGPF